MKFLYIFTFLFLLLFCACQDQTPPPQPSPLILEVNGESYNLKDFMQALRTKTGGSSDEAFRDSEWWTQQKNQVLKNLIEQTLYQQWGSDNQILLTKDQIIQGINRFRSQYPNDYVFKKTLATKGLSFKEWKEQVKKKLLRELVQEKISSSVTVEDKELTDYYKQNKEHYKVNRGIKIDLLTFSSLPEAQAAQDKLIKTPELFDKLKSYTESSGSKNWVDWNPKSSLAPLFNLSQGKISQVISTDYGYMIAKVLRKRKEKTLSLNQVKENIKNDLLKQKKSQFVNQWLKEQFLASKIKINQKLVDALKVYKNKKGL